MPDSRRPDAQEMGYYLSLAQVGLEMIAPLFLGMVIDYFVDSSPWFIIAGLVLGFVGGVTHIVVLTNQHDRATRKDQRGSNTP